METPAPLLVDVNGTELALREWGAPDGKPLLFWHALGDHNTLQLTEVGPILASDYELRCIGVDAPGFGASPRVDDAGYEIPALVELAAGLVETLGLDEVTWMGSSWGASLGVHFAAARPDRVSALVLLDGGYADPAIGKGMTLEEQKAHWRGQPDLFGFESWDEMLADAKEYFRRWSPGLEEMNRASFREEDGRVVSIMGPDVYAAAIHGIQESPPAKAHAALGRSGVPVLLLAATLPADGEPNRAAARERFASAVPQAEIRVLEDTPHFVLEDKPDEAAEAVGAWLRSLG